MCLDDPIADFAEALYGGSPNVVIVFDDQNRLLGRPLGGQRVRQALRRDMFGDQSGKINLYRRPLMSEERRGLREARIVELAIA
jgi:hypothetical protein